jgi:hypothetical protein
MGIGPLSLGVKLTTHFHLVQRSRMVELTATHQNVFMAIFVNLLIKNGGTSPSFYLTKCIPFHSEFVICDLTLAAALRIAK